MKKLPLGIQTFGKRIDSGVIRIVRIIDARKLLNINYVADV